jgi:hypothetical protein
MDKSVGQGSLTTRQVAHGFSVGTPVRSSSGSWVVAQADSEANLADAVVTHVNGDQFVVTMLGFVRSRSHGLGAAGVVRWTSQGTPGATVTTQPTTGYIQRLLEVHDRDWLIVRVSPGEFA